MMFSKRSQSMIEYIVLFIIIIAAFIAMQTYIKRGFQGRWKSAVDELGEQYDPVNADIQTVHSITGSSSSNTTTSGNYTLRSDSDDLTETRTGTVRIKMEP